MLLGMPNNSSSSSSSSNNNNNSSSNNNNNHFTISFSAFFYSLDVFSLFHKLFKHTELVATGNRTQDRLYSTQEALACALYKRSWVLFPVATRYF